MLREIWLELSRSDVMVSTLFHISSRIETDMKLASVL